MTSALKLSTVGEIRVVARALQALAALYWLVSAQDVISWYRQVTIGLAVIAQFCVPELSQRNVACTT